MCTSFTHLLKTVTNNTDSKHEQIMKGIIGDRVQYNAISHPKKKKEKEKENLGYSR
jgi:hypothetical protein